MKVFALMLCLFAIEFLATTIRDMSMIQSSWDKLNHFMAFFVLYILVSISFKKMEKNKKIFWLLVFAVQIEIVQYLIPNRFFSIEDVLADMIGIYAGVLFIKYFKIALPSIYREI